MTSKNITKPASNPISKTQTTSQEGRDGRVTENILNLIGNTPMLKLTKLTSDLQCTILAKLEFFNLGGSIKDRIGISMIEAA